MMSIPSIIDMMVKNRDNIYKAAIESGIALQHINTTQDIREYISRGHVLDNSIVVDFEMRVNMKITNYYVFIVSLQDGSACVAPEEISNQYPITPVGVEGLPEEYCLLYRDLSLTSHALYFSFCGETKRCLRGFSIGSID